MWHEVDHTDTITLDPTHYDQEQINLMEERLILLDNDDKNIGEGSKKDCKHSLTSLSLFLAHSLTRSSLQAI